MKKHPLDADGFASRKFLFAIGVCVMIVVTAIIFAHIPAAIPMFETLVGGLLGALTIFAGSNVATKFACVKSMGNVDFSDFNHQAENVGHRPAPPVRLEEQHINEESA